MRASSFPLILYLGERFPFPRFALFAAFLYCAGRVQVPPTSASFSPLEFFLTSVFLLVFLFQLRLWDDLEDLPSDKTKHPERTLSRQKSVVLFQFIAAVLAGILCLLPLAKELSANTYERGKAHAAAITLFYTGYLIYYPLRRSKGISTTAQAVITALKYSLIAGFGSALQTEITKVHIGGAAVVFCTTYAYEVLHDPNHYSETMNLVLASIACVALLLLCFCLPYAYLSFLNTAYLRNAGLLVLSAMVAVCFFWHCLSSFQGCRPLGHKPILPNNIFVFVGIQNIINLWGFIYVNR